MSTLPTSPLPPVTDPVLRGWLELILLRQEVLAAYQEATNRDHETIIRCLADLPETLREALASYARTEVRAEISEGLAKALLAGRQAACFDPCSLCAAAGGAGCASPTCGRPAA